MIAAIYARSLFAAMGLLACATSASGECAWIWWEEQVDPTSRTWATPVAYPTQAACKEHLARLIEAWDTAHLSGQSVSRDQGGLAAEFITVGRAGFRTSVRRSCLPDTVDPRGPKGSAR